PARAIHQSHSEPWSDQGGCTPKRTTRPRRRSSSTSGRNIGRSGGPTPRGGASERKGYWCPGESSFRDLAPSFSFAVPIDLFQNTIVLLRPRVRQHPRSRSPGARLPSEWWSRELFGRFTRPDFRTARP